MRRAGKFLDTDDSVMLSNWMKMVEDYSSRGLSRPSDRLLAFAAVAENFVHTLGWDCGNRILFQYSSGGIGPKDKILLSVTLDNLICLGYAIVWRYKRSITTLCPFLLSLFKG